MQNIRIGMPILKIQAAYKTQKRCFELEAHFFKRNLKNLFLMFTTASF